MNQPPVPGEKKQKITAVCKLQKVKDGTEIYKNSHDLNNKIENELLQKKILTKSSSLLSDKLSNEIFDLFKSPEKNRAKDIINLLK